MLYHWIKRLITVVFAVALVTVVFAVALIMTVQHLPALDRAMYASIAALKGCGL